MRHLRTFESAGWLGGFSAAAEELHTTQSAVSRTIKDLERLLGTSRSFPGLPGPGAGAVLRDVLYQRHCRPAPASLPSPPVPGCAQTSTLASAAWAASGSIR